MSSEPPLVPRIDYQPIEACDIKPGPVAAKGKVPLSISMEFYNGTGHPIAIADRGGIPIIIPHDNDSERVGKVIVVKRYTVAKESMLDPNRTSLNYGLKTKERDVLNQVISDALETSSYMGYVFSLTYIVEFTQLRDAAGILYLNELDMSLNVVRDMGSPIPVLHPYSDTAARFHLLEEDIEASRIPKFNYMMYIVDRRGTFGKRYTNIQGRVYEVPSTTANINLPDGVYICTSSAPLAGIDFNNSVMEHYRLCEADEKLCLYRSTSDALHFGDAERQHQEDIKRRNEELALQKLELKRELQKIEHELTVKKHEIETAKLEYESIKDSLTHARDREQMQDKDYYAKRSQERKDQSEVIKYIPTMITAGLAIVVAVMKIRS